MNPDVDIWINTALKWKQEMRQLRSIALDCGLDEQIKWGKPCYVFENSNIVLVQAFKGYCALLFFKGALLQDPFGILVKMGENTVVGRQARYSDLQEIVQQKQILKDYILEAVELERTGAKIVRKDDRHRPVPHELEDMFDEVSGLKAAFTALTPGRQRRYQFYFTTPKRSATRRSRIAKCIPRILSGKGLND